MPQRGKNEGMRVLNDFVTPAMTDSFLAVNSSRLMRQFVESHPGVEIWPQDPNRLARLVNQMVS